jgi:hypothetical protein
MDASSNCSSVGNAEPRKLQRAWYDATPNRTESPIIVRNNVAVTFVARASKHLVCGRIHFVLAFFFCTRHTRWTMRLVLCMCRPRRFTGVT